MGARRDTWLLEVFFGLYKPAAILHFSVSTVPAEVRPTDCGGSGRGLPADAHPHIFLDFFLFLKWSLLSGIQVDELSVLTRVGFNSQTNGSTQFLPLFLPGSP